jgi:cobalt transporter subunit CbtA
MLRRILTAALLAGFAAGVFVSALQAVSIAPLILSAETLEASGAPAAAGETAAGDEARHHRGHHAGGHGEGWAPADGLERTVYTVLTNVLAGTGFALLLTACFALTGCVDWRRGVIWGLAGFAVFHLAPALGLPPELPGAAAAPLAERQIWWLATVAATAAGLALVAFGPGRAVKALGVVVILAPHAVGAPEAEAQMGSVPAALAARFVVGSLVTAGLFWVVLGGLSAFLFQRFAKPA